MVDVLMLVLQTHGLIAFAFAFVKIQMQYAVAAPYVEELRQQVFQQSARGRSLSATALFYSVSCARFGV